MAKLDVWPNRGEWKVGGCQISMIELAGVAGIALVPLWTLLDLRPWAQ